MATSKDQTTTTTAKDQPAAKKATAKTEAPYAEQAAALADDTRALAESIREDLGKLTERVHGLNDVETTVNDGPTADGVRRIPMAVEAVMQALHGLVVTAADLTRDATS